MARQKVPTALQEIADELELNLAEEENEREDLEQLVDWIRDQLNDRRNEELERFTDIEAKLDGIET